MWRFLALITACLFLPSCGNNGWRYDTNPSWPGAVHDFSNGTKSELVFRRHLGPVASLTGFDSDHGSFALNVDGKTRSVFATQFEGTLIVEDPSAINDIALAQSTIVFARSKAVRKVPASALVGKFLADCALLAKSKEIAWGEFFAMAAPVLLLLSISFLFGYRQDWGDGESVSRYLVSNAIALSFFYVVAVRERLDVRLLAWIGAISYPLYLIHEPIRVLALAHAPVPSGLPVLALALVAIIIISAVMHYFVELPFQRLGRQFANSDWRNALAFPSA